MSTIEHYNRNIFQKAKDKAEDVYNDVKFKVKSAAYKLTHDRETQANVLATAIVVGTVVQQLGKAKRSWAPTQYEIEAKRREKQFYDKSSQLWFDVRRKMTNDEIQYVREEVKNGRKANDVLRELGLAKG